jgi:tetratricopeptide (TPR) repeat protein
VARAALASALESRGRRQEALAEYDRVIAAYNEADPRPEELACVAEAAVRATRLSANPADDMLRGAPRLLGARLEKDPSDVDALLALGDLWQSYRGRDGQAKAGTYYQKILSENPEIAEARVGLARIALLFYDQGRATELCTRALATNPSLVPAMNLLARVHVGDGDYEKADAMWERARAVNPRDKEARAVRAARLRIGGDVAAGDRLIAEILADDPTYGRAWTTVAELVGERQRRYDVAAEMSGRAIAVDPSDDQAYVVMGANLMHLGRDAEAKAAFEKAVEASKRYKDVVRDNYLQALEVLDTFVTARSAFSSASKPALSPVIQSRAARVARASLSRGFTFLARSHSSSAFS